jgi:hypothetical protein
MPKDSLPYSEHSTAGLYPEPEESSPDPPILFKIILILCSHPRLGPPGVLYIFSSKYSISLFPIHTTCPAHLIHCE